MIQQGNDWTNMHGKHLNGYLTCGENTADLGGLIVSQHAMEEYLKEHEFGQPDVYGDAQNANNANEQPGAKDVSKDSQNQADQKEQVLLQMDEHEVSEDEDGNATGVETVWQIVDEKEVEEQDPRTGTSPF